MAVNDNSTQVQGVGTQRRRSLGQIRGFTRFLESTDSLIYALVGVSFLVAALFSLCYSIVKFALALWTSAGSSFNGIFSGASTGTALINFVSDLLLTLIIMEVFGTVVHYLRTRATSLKPFLFIGIISATRGVLAVGARLSVEDFQQLSHGNAAEFRYSMIELGVNAGVIIALGLALRLIGHFLDDEPTAVSE
jgi:uncharacterized membrane protein (DUF373 family)